MWSARTRPRFGTRRHVTAWESGDVSPRSKGRSLHADAIEVGAAVRGAGVRETGGAGLADEVALQGGKGGWRGEIRGALEIIGARVHALPTPLHASDIVGGRRRQHGQHGRGIGWIQTGNPFLPVVHAGAI